MSTLGSCFLQTSCYQRVVEFSRSGTRRLCSPLLWATVRPYIFDRQKMEHSQPGPALSAVPVDGAAYKVLWNAPARTYSLPGIWTARRFSSSTISVLAALAGESPDSLVM